MATVSDHMMLLKSKEQLYEPVFEKSAWLYVNDTNQSYESSTSVIETGALSNSSKYMIYNKAYISVPFLVTITGALRTGDVSEIAIKQSFLSLVNSITVDLNGTNVVQQNSLIDIVNHFQLLTQESASTVPRWSTIGLGLVDDRASLLDLGGDVVFNQSGMSQSELQKLHQSNKSVDTDDVTQYSARAIIYLKDLHPLFQSIPISKALNFKIQILIDFRQIIGKIKVSEK